MPTTRLQAFISRVRDRLGMRFEAIPDDAGVARLVELILEDAVKRKATAIQFDYSEKDFAVRYCIEGTFYDMMKPPLKLHQAMYRRLALLGNYRNRRGPQRCWFERDYTTSNRGKARFKFDFELPLTLGTIHVLRED